MSNEDSLYSRIYTAVKPYGGTGLVGASSSAAKEICEAFIIIPKADLPSVKRSEHDGNTYYTEGENVVYTSEDNARMWCLRDIAVWEFIRSEGAAHVRRREELAQELSPLLGVTFDELSPAAKNAIDRIIELESA